MDLQEIAVLDSIYNTWFEINNKLEESKRSSCVIIIPVSIHINNVDINTKMNKIHIYGTKSC